MFEVFEKFRIGVAALSRRPSFSQVFSPKPVASKPGALKPGAWSSVWKLPLPLLVLVAATLPVLSQDSQFGRLSLARGGNAEVSGRTGGQTSLPAIVRDRDNAGNLCLGFATSTPDAILVLENDFPRVVLQVNSGGHDTTLVVQGPGGIRCGDDTGRNKDASIQGIDWSSGTYRIWVGTITSGARHNYTLTVRE